MDSKIHPVFHVSQLKPFTPKYTPVFADLPRPPDLAGTADEPMEIVERRMVKHGNNALVQVRIRWRNDATATTWEDYDTLRHRFPQASVWDAPAASDSDHQQATEDGASSQGMGNVTPASPGGDAVDA